MNETSEKVEIPVFTPNAVESLTVAKNFMSKAVTKLLDENKFNAAKSVIDGISNINNIIASISGYSSSGFPVATSSGFVDNNLDFDSRDNRFTVKETEAIVAGRKIDAIKLVRERTGKGLKEAKEQVESHYNYYNHYK
jgi:ribosomal protein L7/L12